MRKTRSLLALVFTIVMLMSLAYVSQAQEKVTLRVTLRGEFTSIPRDNLVVEWFEKKYPSIRISKEILPSASFVEFDSTLGVWIAAGTEPDLVCLDFSPLTHVLNGSILSLTPFMEKDEEFQKFKYWNLDQAETYKFGSQIYALPQGPFVYGIWINEDIFDEAGVDYPELGWTMDDFVTIGQALTKDLDGDGRLDQYGYESEQPGFYDSVIGPLAKQLGKSCWKVDEETGVVNGVNLKDSDIIELFQWAADLMNKYKIAPGPELGDLSALGLTFFTGTVGMRLGATWSISQLATLVGDSFKYRFVANPMVKPGLRQPRNMGLVRPTGAILATTEYPEEAWTFLREYSGYESEKLIYDNTNVTPQGIPYFRDSLVNETFMNQDPPGKESMDMIREVMDLGGNYWMVINKLPRGWSPFIGTYRQGSDTFLKGEKTAREVFIDDGLADALQDTVKWDEELEKKIRRVFGK